MIGWFRPRFWPGVYNGVYNEAEIFGLTRAPFGRLGSKIRSSKFGKRIPENAP